MFPARELIELSKSGSYFIYNLDELAKHATQINNGAAKVFFACKANPLSKVITTLHKLGMNFDVASHGELSQVLSLGIDGSKIIMTGPAKSEKLLRYAMSNKVATFVIESYQQLKIIEDLHQEYGYTPNLLLRLQLKWDLEDNGNGIGGNKITAFGVDLQEAKQILAKSKLHISGFHVFQWGNITSAKLLGQIWEETINACKTLQYDFKILDVGGGLGIPYTKDTSTLDWLEINYIIQDIKARHNLEEFWIEMGRFMTGPYGCYITKVIDIKTNYDTKIVILENGLNHTGRTLMAKRHFPLKRLEQNLETEIPHVEMNIHGPLCTSNDFLGTHLLPSNLEIGDTLVANQAGAYGFTNSLPFFLCHPLAGEAVIDNGKLSIVREVADPLDFWMR